MTDPGAELRAGDAMLVVDPQVDFCPGGALPIPNGDRVMPVLNTWMAAAAARGLPVYVSRDWHPAGHPSFLSEGGRWPVHCLQDSPGAAFHPALRLPAGALVVTKGTRFDQDQYSAFDQTGLEARLRKDGVRRLWMGGLAQDVCVFHSAMDAIRLGFAVHMIPDAALPVTADGATKAVAALRDAGAHLAPDVSGHG